MRIAAVLFLFSLSAFAQIPSIGPGQPRNWEELLASNESPYLYSLDDIRDWGDVLYRLPHHPRELDDPALSAATKEFGPLIIRLSSLPFDSGIGEAPRKPWSSWWFPKIDRDLFDDGRGSSPLEKYDIVRFAFTGKRSGAAAYERNNYTGSGPHWEGLCDAWAIAASIYPEPETGRSIRMPNGSEIYFSVGDQKALLLESVSAVPPESLKRYGQRFTGNEDGWVFPDIFPQELLRYVQKQLFEAHRMFVMDHDPGVEVWNEPVYKANYILKAVPGQPDTLDGKLWLFSAASFTDKQQKDHTGMREIAREYVFQLYGADDGHGNFVVDSGEWIKGDLVDSRADHPDFVYNVAEPSALKRASQNPEIDPLIVDKILGWKIH
jgi:hypothetical protein